MNTLTKIIKSPNDNRIYKAVQLSNQLLCVLISDTSKPPHSPSVKPFH